MLSPNPRKRLDSRASLRGAFLRGRSAGVLSPRIRGGNFLTLSTAASENMPGVKEPDLDASSEDEHEEPELEFKDAGLNRIIIVDNLPVVTKEKYE